MPFTDLAAHAFGLRTERQILTNQMLQDYNPKLTLRRIGERDPAFAAGQKFNPPRVLGVWEEPVARGETNWVFTLAEISVDPVRILARVAENDFSKANGKERFDRLLAFKQLEEAVKLKELNDKNQERREEMITAGKLMRRNGTVRMKINGEDVLVGDTITPVRKFISS